MHPTWSTQFTPLARLARVGAAWCLPPTFLGTNGYSQVNTAAGPAGQQRSDGGFAMCATLCIRGQRSFTRAACLPVRPSGLSHLAGAASTLCTGRTLQAHHRATPPRASFWTIRSGSATLLRLALASSAQIRPSLCQVSCNGYGMATGARGSLVRGEAAEVAGVRRGPAPEARRRIQHELPTTPANTPLNNLT